MMVRNVIIFGEAGVGKSSTINLIVGSQVAKTSPDADPCTTRAQSHNVTIDGKEYRLWDTPGLGGGARGFFRTRNPEKDLKTLLRDPKNEPSLLLYCVRACRATRALVDHYRSTRLESAVPMAIVVTGLEKSPGDMESWWGQNATALSDYGMQFVDHACITCIDDNTRVSTSVRTRRAQSQDIVRNLISRNCL